MKIIKNNANLQDMVEKEKSVFPIKLTCENCNSEFEIEEDDVEVGELGLYKLKKPYCPCCGNNIDDTLDEGIDLTIDNLEYPRHYSSFKNGVNIKDEKINKLVRECIEAFDENDENDWVRFIGGGNTMVIVFKYDEDNEYNIIVCKDYLETFIPIV